MYTSVNNAIGMENYFLRTTLHAVEQHCSQLDWTTTSTRAVITLV